jgi:hypothetical protein
MNPKSQTPLEKIVSDQALLRTLASLWIVSAEELIGVDIAIRASGGSGQEAGATGSLMSRAVAAARTTLGPEHLEALSAPKAGGSLGCVVEPRILEDFRRYGRLRPSEMRPAHAFEAKLPSAVRLMDRMPAVKDQGQRGTCVAFGTAALREFLLEEYEELSEQFLYWACKQLDGDLGPGTTLHTAMTALSEYGVCKAQTWPYNPVQMEDEAQGYPPEGAFEDAKKHLLSSTRTVEPGLVLQYKHILAGSRGVPQMPVSVATLVFDSWYMSPQTHRRGKITMPLPSEQPTSGHAWCIVGYVDDAQAPGGGYFIVRNSWGNTWASDSPEAPGHAIMPYAYVDRYAIEAFTGPAVAVEPSCEPNPQWRDFVRVLQRDERDLDGKLLRSGSVVLCHPSQPEAFREDSHANREEFVRQDRTWTPEVRQRLWFPPVSHMPSDFTHQVETCRAARKAFLAAIDENMVLAKDQPIPEVQSLPLWFDLLAWEPRIKTVSEVADLSESFATRMAQDNGVPPQVAWPKEWGQQLADLNTVKVYALNGLTATIHVVATVATPIRFHAGSNPEILPPDQGTADLIRDVYRQWVCTGRHNRPTFTFFTVGSALPWPAEVTGQAAGDHWLIVSHLSDNDEWETRTPPRFADRLSLRNFLDRLRPVTQQQRVSRIKSLVDDLLDCGYEGNIRLEKIAKETGYRRTAVRDALLTLRNSGHYRLYKTSGGDIAVGAATSGAGIPATPSRLRSGWLPRLACLGPAIGVGIWFAKDVIIGRPFEFQSFVVLLPLAYGGEWLNVHFRKWREDKE